MPRTAKGPLVELYKPNGENIVGRGKCDACGRPILVKINRSGWLYANCPHRDGCGYLTKAQSITASLKIAGTIKDWVKGYKVAVLEALNPPANDNEPENAEPAESDRSEKSAGGGNWWDY